MNSTDTSEEVSSRPLPQPPRTRCSWSRIAPAEPLPSADGAIPSATTTVVQPDPTVRTALPARARSAPDGWSADRFGAVPSVTVAPGGGENRNWSSPGTSKLILVKPTENAGPSALARPNSCTRSGTDVSASTASRTWPTSDRVSFGASTSSYASRPATVRVPSVLTAVVGSIAASACSAACCGVSGLGTGGCSPLPALPAGSV